MSGNVSLITVVKRGGACSRFSPPFKAEILCGQGPGTEVVVMRKTKLGSFESDEITAWVGGMGTHVKEILKMAADRPNIEIRRITSPKALRLLRRLARNCRARKPYDAFDRIAGLN